ncbi:hypothetical protein Dsin_012700 [Dipteronia sinensis]|uniref:Uncharacterized protein n=1 Tax=Dipteronia sinensis TaxID=43782 RepID=A0AAE0AJE9_9ROSI|nr:hypothetical protein Dsin_012700 [Dipteronia sinensis]
MGCISSKLVSRSLSFQEELNQSLHRRRGANDNSKSSSSGHFLALLSSANLQPNQILSSESNKCSKPTVELVRKENSDTWELKASLEQEGNQPASPVQPKVRESVEVDLARRSKSFHWFEDYEVSSLATESFDRITERRSNRTNGGRPRTRSFHTVEEFDEMVGRICLSRAGQTGFGGKEDGSLQLHHSKSSSDLSHAAHKPYQDEYGVEKNTVIEEMGTLFRSLQRPENVIPSLDRSSKKEEITRKGNIFVKGLKRKAMANELESLKIPPSVEFPGVAALREWIHAGGQVYSPSTYVTPKFGSYNLPKSGLAIKCSDDTLFAPELVAAFEECMEQLEVEEESILKQTEENLKEENAQKKQDEEEIPSHRNNSTHMNPQKKY